MNCQLECPFASWPVASGFALLGLAILLQASAAAAENRPPLNTARQVHELSSEEAAKGYPVHIRGVVTSCDIGINQLFVQDATDGMYIAIGASALIAEDIVNLPLFSGKLGQTSGSNSVSLCLVNQLTPTTRSRLATYQGGPDPELQQALATDLNERIRNGSSLFEPGRFAGIALSPPTELLLAEVARGEPGPGRRNSRDAVTARLNRLLLEDAYPGCLATNRNPERFGFMLEVGQVLDIEGISARGGFAPDIIPTTVRLIGRAELPAPRLVAFEQMAAGQEDCSWVEFGGIVRAFAMDEFTTLPALYVAGGGGRVVVPVQEAEIETCKRLIDAEVKVRGVCTTQFNPRGQLIRVAVQASTMADVRITKPAPSSTEALVPRSINTLLRYSPREEHGHRVKVAGVVVLQQPGRALVIADETQGLYIRTRQGTPLQPGDMIEVLGFPLAGEYVSPVLEEAVFRKIGQAKPLTPRKIAAEEGRLGRNDATLVEMEATLLNRVRRERDQILELESSQLIFYAEAPTSPKKHDLLASIPNGSRVRLTGVCLVRPDQEGLADPSQSFRLLLGSASDVALLAKPSWWTVEHTLWVLAGTLAVFLASLTWVAVLRKQVKAQTRIIRQKAQREAALEERTRIARDLHDELGSSLTHITLLSDRSEKDVGSERETSARKIALTAREMAQSLDAIVWAINPQHDTLEGLVEYLSQYADDFLEDTPIHSRIELPANLPHCPVLAEVRHQLFLAFAEALTNAVRHAAASEIQIEMAAEPDEFRIRIVDNGLGFDPASIRTGGNGLKNMQQRLESIGGRFGLSSKPGHGSQVNLSIPLGRG